MKILAKKNSKSARSQIHSKTEKLSLASEPNFCYYKNPRKFH